MIARVASRCFWFGRYLERTESLARVLSALHSASQDNELDPALCWGPLLLALGEDARFVAREGDKSRGDGERVQEHFSWEPAPAASILSSAGGLRDNARSIREVLSLEVFSDASELWLWLASDAARELFDERRSDFYRHVRRGTGLCFGLLESTMLRDEALDVIWLGVMLERLGQTARVIDLHHHALERSPTLHPVAQASLWLTLLRASSGFEPFLKRQTGEVTFVRAASFLLLESRFPRSLRHAIQAAHERLSALVLPEGNLQTGAEPLERLHALDDRLAAAAPRLGDPGVLHQLLTHVIAEASAVGDLVGREILAEPRP